MISGPCTQTVCAPAWWRRGKSATCPPDAWVEVQIRRHNLDKHPQEPTLRRTHKMCTRRSRSSPRSTPEAVLCRNIRNQVSAAASYRPRYLFSHWSDARYRGSRESTCPFISHHLPRVGMSQQRHANRSILFAATHSAVSSWSFFVIMCLTMPPGKPGTEYRVAYPSSR